MNEKELVEYKQQVEDLKEDRDKYKKLYENEEKINNILSKKADDAT